MSEIEVVPASSASWEELDALLGKGTGRDGDRCYCQRFSMPGRRFWYSGDAEKADRLRDQTACGEPGAPSSGLVAMAGGEVIGWVAVAPRVSYEGLLGRRVVWSGREESKTDEGVWAVTCFVVKKGHRRQGLTSVLAKAAAEHAREQGATAVEGYAMITTPGKDITWGELHVGPLGAFLDAGFREVARPTLRRMVMRIDFPG